MDDPLQHPAIKRLADTLATWDMDFATANEYTHPLSVRYGISMALGLIRVTKECGGTLDHAERVVEALLDRTMDIK